MIFVWILLGVALIFGIIRILVVFSDKIKFFSTGADSGFKFSEISLLWRLAKIIDLEEPLALYWSSPALGKGISRFLEEAKVRGDENAPKNQELLAKLYDFRTKLDIASREKRGLDSTKNLDSGQKLRLILKGAGVFFSEILNSGRELVITLPVQNGIPKISAELWCQKNVSVYLWRKGDAAYVFDTIVKDSGVFNGRSVLLLEHSYKLFRTQKRKSVRAECRIPAKIFFIKDESKIDYKIENQGGFRCILEDISEDGALIHVGGRCKKDSKIKLQFFLEDFPILMFGMVRAVEFNEKNNQSRLHFECLSITREMKNRVLSFVYNDLKSQDSLKRSGKQIKKNQNFEENQAENSKIAKKTEKITDDAMSIYESEDLEQKKIEKYVQKNSDLPKKQKIAPEKPENFDEKLTHLSLLYS